MSLLNSSKWCQSLIMLDDRCTLKACLFVVFTDRHQVIHATHRMPVVQAWVFHIWWVMEVNACCCVVMCVLLSAHLWLISWQTELHSVIRRKLYTGMFKVLWKRHERECLVCESTLELLMTTQVDNDFLESVYKWIVSSLKTWILSQSPLRPLMTTVSQTFAGL